MRPPGTGTSPVHPLLPSHCCWLLHGCHPPPRAGAAPTVPGKGDGAVPSSPALTQGQRGAGLGGSAGGGSSVCSQPEALKCNPPPPAHLARVWPRPIWRPLWRGGLRGRAAAGAGGWQLPPWHWAGVPAAGSPCPCQGVTQGLGPSLPQGWALPGAPSTSTSGSSSQPGAPHTPRHGCHTPAHLCAQPHAGTLGVCRGCTHTPQAWG